jgi:pimeloyl-ACP methyl ester carboxylesterase
LRNGEFSDWHDENSYEVYAADIIRWADKNGIWKFDLFGHSMGGKLV